MLGEADPHISGRFPESPSQEPEPTDVFGDSGAESEPVYLLTIPEILIASGYMPGSSESIVAGVQMIGNLEENYNMLIEDIGLGLPSFVAMSLLEDRGVSKEKAEFLIRRYLQVLSMDSLTDLESAEDIDPPVDIANEMLHEDEGSAQLSSKDGEEIFTASRRPRKKKSEWEVAHVSDSTVSIPYEERMRLAEEAEQARDRESVKRQKESGDVPSEYFTAVGILQEMAGGVSLRNKLAAKRIAEKLGLDPKRIPAHRIAVFKGELQAILGSK